MMPSELTTEYYVHQAREFHKSAAEALAIPPAILDILTNLVIAVDYLIELEEARLKEEIR